MNFRRREVEDIDVNLTPLIDVVFLLLIFFMVSTSFEHQSKLSIDLPQAQGEQSNKEDKSINIAIDAENQFYINQNKLTDISAEALMHQLEKIIKDKKDAQIVISADKNTSHQQVMKVMDVARRLQLTHLTFAAVKPD